MIFIDTIFEGNNIETLKKLPDKSIDCCVTSPPYYHLRTYNIDNEIGQEETISEYTMNLVKVFREVKRVLKLEGTLWLNLGDSYSGSGNGTNDYRTGDHIRISLKGHQGRSSKDRSLPAKSLCGIPWRVAFALQDDGWMLRQDIIWAKPSVMPESVKDRFCKSHEYVFLFVKNSKYYFDQKAATEIATGYGRLKDDAYEIVDDGKITFENEQGQQSQVVDVPMRTRRDVWTIASEPSCEGHFAMYPQKLVLQCLLCGCPEGGVVLDPFMGSGTTAIVARKNNRHFVGCELNPEYVKMAHRRLAEVNPLFG